MNAIEIKINHVALQSICEVIEGLQLHQAFTPHQKVVVSIMKELTIKLLKKEIDKRPTQRKFKMTFRYYEAFALEQSCRTIYANQLGDTYANLTALDIANQIHKQL